MVDRWKCLKGGIGAPTDRAHTNLVTGITWVAAATTDGTEVRQAQATKVSMYIYIHSIQASGQCSGQSVPQSVRGPVRTGLPFTRQPHAKLLQAAHNTQQAATEHAPSRFSRIPYYYTSVDFFVSNSEELSCSHFVSCIDLKRDNMAIAEKFSRKVNKKNNRNKKKSWKYGYFCWQFEWTNFCWIFLYRSTQPSSWNTLIEDRRVSRPVETARGILDKITWAWTVWPNVTLPNQVSAVVSPPTSLQPVCREKVRWLTTAVAACLWGWGNNWWWRWAANYNFSALATSAWGS